MSDLIKRLRDEPKHSEQINGLNALEMNVWHNTALEAADALEQAQGDCLGWKIAAARYKKMIPDKANERIEAIEHELKRLVALAADKAVTDSYIRDYVQQAISALLATGNLDPVGDRQ